MALVNIFEDPIIRPPSFLSRFRLAPLYTLGLLTGRYTAYGALYFYPTDDVFKACCKTGDILLP